MLVGKRTRPWGAPSNPGEARPDGPDGHARRAGIDRALLCDGLGEERRKAF